MRPLLVTTAIVVATTLSLGGGATFVALEVTTQPDFCRSCHIMEPYYDSWASSSHADVACVDCHYEPGLLETFEGKFKAMSQLAKYITATEGSKPWAEVSDYSCMRSGCHSERLLEGEIQFGRIRFDHREHLIGMQAGKELRCTSCHSQIVQGDHLTVTPSSCILCHFKSDGEGGTQDLDDCELCHGPPSDAIELGDFTFRHSDYLDRGVDCASCHGDVTRGAGEVPPERCGSCHNQQAHLERIGDLEFIHSHHVTDHSVTCLDCHLEIQHGLPERETHFQGNCQECHEGSHGVASDLYRGTGGRDVPDNPGVMFMARVTCTGCHRPPFPDAPVPAGGATFTADPLSCIDCHGPGFEGMTEDWQAEVHDAVGAVKGEVDALHAKLAAQAPGAAADEARAKYETAAYNLSLVMLDASGGVHNLAYARDLLKQSAEDAHAGWAALDPKRKAAGIRIGPAVDSPSGCTTLCHTAPEALPVQSARGLPFPHATHMLDAGMDCTECHRAEPHGSSAIARTDCASCHHEQEDPDQCGACHAAAADLRDRTVDGVDEIAMQDLDCMECHMALEPGMEKQMARQGCQLCHMGEDLDPAEWIASTARPLDELEQRLDGAPADLAERIAEQIDALRDAGTLHNAPFVEAEAARLGALLDPPPPDEPPVDTPPTSPSDEPPPEAEKP